MKTIQILIVDDEPLARDSAARLLRRVPGAEVCGECADGGAALAFIRTRAPDLVLLDVQMPRMSGVELLARLAPAERPSVVFVTAYDAFALRAFDLHAVDYVLKPYDDDRFLQAVERGAAVARSRQSGILDEKVDQLVKYFLRRGASAAGPVVFRSSGDRYFVKPDDIVWIEGEGDYLRVHTTRQHLLIRETMSDLLARLPAGRFARVHKSSIVNLEHVRGMHAIYSGDYTLELADGTTVRVSRIYREKLLQLAGAEA